MSQIPSPLLPWVPIYHEIWETGVFRSELCFSVFSQDPVWGFQSLNDELFELSVPGELCLCLMHAESQLAAAMAQMSPGASLWNRWINHMRSEARLCLSGSVSDKRLPATAELCSIFCFAGCGKGEKNHQISRGKSPSDLSLYRQVRGPAALG